MTRAKGGGIEDASKTCRSCKQESPFIGDIDGLCFGCAVMGDGMRRD